VTNVRIGVLGRFDVTVDGQTVPARAWGRRHPAALVKLLAVRPERRLHREQVLDFVWPDDPIETATAKLHKAAHYARRATGHPGTIVLGGELVQLFPDVDVLVDAAEFERGATDAIARGDTDRATGVVGLYRGDLLPDDLYEDWAAGPRERLQRLYVALLTLLERWEDVVAIEPGDERAHLELMRRYAGAGDRYGALRQFDRLDRTLRTELGVQPGHEAAQLRDRLLRLDTGDGERDEELVGRDTEVAALDRALVEAARGGARTVVISGPPGIGKSALVQRTVEQASALGWRVGVGAGASIEGAWAYAPLLDAVADLCRRHPALLDGLADMYRHEIDRVLAGVEAPWTGQSTHQRLFVAVAELLRLASATSGVVLALDDLHHADEATLRLLHYLSRALAEARVLLVVTHRTTVPMPATLNQLHAGFVGRHGGIELELAALDPDAARLLIVRHAPEATDEQTERILTLAGGNPYIAIELAERASGGPTWAADLDALAVAGIPPATREVLQHVAVAGSAFDIDEFVALSGLPDDDAFARLDHAVALRVLEPADAGYRFRHRLVRDALLEGLPLHRRQRIHREAAERLEALGASPARVGHHLVEAGEALRAVPFLLAAAETEAAIGAYRDALALVDAVRPNATGSSRARLLVLRADLLMALGDPSAVSAYREALEQAEPPARRRLLARLARAAVMSGDLDTAEASLEGIEPDGGPDDGEILLAQGHTAFFTSNYPRAAAVAEEARRRVLAGDKTWQVLDLVSLQGLLAHQRGEWFDRMRTELRNTRDVPEVANAVFDGYLCPAEYLLYGPTPYGDVIDTARRLRATALRSGALRAVAFASALIGEAALLSGDLALATEELREAVDLHHDLGSAAGEAHSLQRLGEVRLAAGDPDAARALLDRALPLARWSIMARHLLQRIYGTMISAAPDPMLARGIVDRAESTLGSEDLCGFCSIMLSLPAVAACVRVGDLDHARVHLRRAERSVQLWEGTAWEAALTEARSGLALAEGDPERSAELLQLAAARFERAGQPLDVDRCRRQLRALTA
jgi:DNA-binding SARP family transcriptional activator/tetratricopeptide (TPR) repeat protein